MSTITGSVMAQEAGLNGRPVGPGPCIPAPSSRRACTIKQASPLKYSPTLLLAVKALEAAAFLLPPRGARGAGGFAALPALALAASPSAAAAAAGCCCLAFLPLAAPWSAAAAARLPVSSSSAGGACRPFCRTETARQPERQQVCVSHKLYSIGCTC